MKITNIVGFCSLFLTACVSQEALLAGQPQWDFDHQLQYSETKQAERTYLLEIIPNDRIHFQKIAAFLLRQAYKRCQGYGFKLEVLQGIEGFDHQRQFPNMISERFQALVQCPTDNKDKKVTNKVM